MSEMNECNKMVNNIKGLWAELNDEQRLFLMRAALGMNENSKKSDSAEYNQRPILPKNMSGVTEKEFGGSSQRAVGVSGRFCPSWANRDLRKGDIAIHMPTGGMFALETPALSQGGWRFKGWATDTYDGRVKTEYTIPKNVLNNAPGVKSFGEYSALVKPERKKNEAYNPGEWLVERTMKTIGQHNYACKKLHAQGLI